MAIFPMNSFAPLNTSSASLVGEAVTPWGCALVIGIPLTKSEFLEDLERADKSFAQHFVRSQGKTTFRGVTAEFYWRLFEPVAKLVHNVCREAEKRGCTVCCPANLGDLSGLLVSHQVVTLVAHWHFQSLKPIDIRNAEQFLDRLRHPCNSAQKAWHEALAIHAPELIQTSPPNSRRSWSGALQITESRSAPTTVDHDHQATESAQDQPSFGGVVPGTAQHDLPSILAAKINPVLRAAHQLYSREEGEDMDRECKPRPVALEPGHPETFDWSGVEKGAKSSRGSGAPDENDTSKRAGAKNESEPDYVRLPQRLTRVRLELAFPENVEPAPCVEFHDGLQPVAAVLTQFPASYRGVVDLTVCNSVILGDAIKLVHRECLVTMNRYPADLVDRMIFYDLVIASLVRKSRPYRDACVAVYKSLKE
jgi:hypothetical protein